MPQSKLELPQQQNFLKLKNVEIEVNRRTYKWRDWAGGAFILGLVLGFAVRISEQPAITAPPSYYTPEEVSYFLDVAMGGEFGASPDVIRKWQGTVRMKVHGTPTPEDLTALRQTIQDLEGLTNVQIDIVYDLPNLDIHFVPESDFRKHEPNYQPLNYGFFWAHWHLSGEIYRARILISTVGVSQKERSHLIREELTQSLGLMQDSTQYPDSIFFQGWTDHTQYADIDRAVIQMLYHPAVQPGMTREQAIEVLSSEEN